MWGNLSTPVFLPLERTRWRTERRIPRNRKERRPDREAVAVAAVTSGLFKGNSQVVSRSWRFFARRKNTRFWQRCEQMQANITNIKNCAVLNKACSSLPCQCVHVHPWAFLFLWSATLFLLYLLTCLDQIFPPKSKLLTPTSERWGEKRKIKQGRVEQESLRCGFILRSVFGWDVSGYVSFLTHSEWREHFLKFTSVSKQVRWCITMLHFDEFIFCSEGGEHVEFHLSALRD